MVVNDLDVMRVTISPMETHPPLVIDANAVLPFTVPRQFLQPVPWRDSKVVKRVCGVKHDQFSLGRPLNVPRQLPCAFPPKDLLGLAIAEAPDHEAS
jgi:hypothetical protein